MKYKGFFYITEQSPIVFIWKILFGMKVEIRNLELSSLTYWERKEEAIEACRESAKEFSIELLN